MLKSNSKARNKNHPSLVRDTVTVTIRLQRRQLDAIDRQAVIEHRTRTNLVEMVVGNYADRLGTYAGESPVAADAGDAALQRGALCDHPT